MRMLAVVVAIAGLGWCSDTRNGWIVLPFELKPVLNETSTPQRRSFGGYSAEEGQFKFMVFVLMRQKYSCSASLIKPDWVLLAAHCFVAGAQPKDLRVIGGRANVEQYAVYRIYRVGFDGDLSKERVRVKEAHAKEVFIHPKYHVDEYDHDIALIQLQEKLKGFKFVTIPISKEKIKREMTCTVVGFGLKPRRMEPYQLHYLKNAKVMPKGCVQNFSEAMICLESIVPGLCEGDSGSPLVCSGKVWGVCSHSSFTNRSFTTCGDSTHILYSSVYPHLKWLNNVIELQSLGTTNSRNFFALVCAASLVTAATS